MDSFESIGDTCLLATKADRRIHRDFSRESTSALSGVIAAQLQNILRRVVLRRRKK